MNCGVYIAKKRVFENYEVANISLENDIIPEILKNYKCYSHNVHSKVYDIGTPERIKIAENFFKQHDERQSNNKLYKRNVSPKTKKIIASKQEWKCNICGKILDFTYEVDHINELRYGGNNEIDNLQALCPNCHRRKTYIQ